MKTIDLGDLGAIDDAEIKESMRIADATGYDVNFTGHWSGNEYKITVHPGDNFKFVRYLYNDLRWEKRISGEIDTNKY